jgi:hypothetical protein
VRPAAPDDVTVAFPLLEIAKNPEELPETMDQLVDPFLADIVPTTVPVDAGKPSTKLAALTTGACPPIGIREKETSITSRVPPSR